MNLTELRPTSVITSGDKVPHLQSGVDWTSVTKGRSTASLLLSSLKDHHKAAFFLIWFQSVYPSHLPLLFPRLAASVQTLFPPCSVLFWSLAEVSTVSPCPGTALTSCWLQRKEVCHLLTLPLILRLKHSQTPSEKFSEGNDFTPRRCFAGVHSSGKEFVGAYRYSTWEISTHRKGGTHCLKLLSCYSFEVY